MIFRGYEYKNILCVKYDYTSSIINYKTLSNKSVPMKDMYMADLILCFKEKEIAVIKDRYRQNDKHGQNDKIYFENDDEFAKLLLLL